MDYWENKNCSGWWRTLDWQDKEWLAITSRYFSLNRPLCPCAPHTVGEDKQTVQSNVTRCPQKKVPSTVTRLAVSLSLPSISSLLYFGQMPPTHTQTPTQVNWEPLWRHRGPASHHTTGAEALKLLSAKGKGGKILPNGAYSRSKTVFYVLGVLVKQTSTRKYLFFWVLSL